MSLEEVAQRYGVSRERVRQILQVDGGPAGQSVVVARRRRAEQQVADRFDELMDLWRAGAHPAHAACALGLQAAACCDAIQRFATEPDRTARRANLASTRVVATRYSDRDIVLAVQFLANRLQRAPSAKDYAPLGREPGFPSLATVINRMDGWSNALGAAGLAPVSGPVAGRSRRWTAEVCRAALFDVVGELGEIPTIAGYDRHACNRDDLPSSATIRIRLGRWSAITTQIANERETFAARAEEALLLRPPLTSAAKTPRGCPGYPLPYPGGREAPV